MNARRANPSPSSRGHRPRVVRNPPFRPPGEVLNQVTIFGSLKFNFPVDPSFLQKMVNRLLVGHYRYGENGSRQDYLRRARQALTDYANTGNVEFLIDAANYAMLEAHYPLHYNVHLKAVDKGYYRDE